MTVERLRSLGSESKLENLRAELGKRKEHKKQREESTALNKLMVSFCPCFFKHFLLSTHRETYAQFNLL